MRYSPTPRVNIQPSLAINLPSQIGRHSRYQDFSLSLDLLERTPMPFVEACSRSRRQISRYRSLTELEASLRVSATYRLGVCQSRQEGQTAILAWVVVSSAFETGTGSGGDSGQGWVAYATTHVRHLDDSEWRRHQDDPGALTTFELQGDCRHVHTSRHSDEACSADKARQNDSSAEQAGGGKTGVQRVMFSYRTLSNPRRKGPIPINHLFCWRPRRDLNPCYRRESRPRVRN